MNNNQTNSYSEIKYLARKYLGNNIDSMDFDKFFSNNSVNLHVCVMATRNYPKLNDFLEEYLNTYDNYDINKFDIDGWTALHCASYYSGTRSTDRTVELLINAGADVNLQSRLDESALHIVSRNIPVPSTMRTFEILILANADVFNLKNIYGRAPIYYFSKELLEYCQIDKDTQTIGIKSGKLTKQAKK